MHAVPPTKGSSSGSKTRAILQKFGGGQHRTKSIHAPTKKEIVKSSGLLYSLQRDKRVLALCHSRRNSRVPSLQTRGSGGGTKVAGSHPMHDMPPMVGMACKARLGSIEKRGRGTMGIESYSEQTVWYTKVRIGGGKCAQRADVIRMVYLCGVSVWCIHLLQ